MTKLPSASLGDAYPALRNFLKLTALTLEVPQVALTIQVGAQPYMAGALSYGPLTQVVLRQMLEAPLPTLTPITALLSLGTMYRGRAPTGEPDTLVTGPQTALVGRLHPPQTSYYFTLYIPGMVAEALSAAQVKTLAYLSQQVLLCLRTVPLPPGLVPSPLPSQRETPEDPDQPTQDFLSRVVSINPPRPVGEGGLTARWPSLGALVAQIQACLSYEQLGDLLGEALPSYFPQQAGQVMVIGGTPPTAQGIAHWGTDPRLHPLTQQCPLVSHPGPMPRLGLCTWCHGDLPPSLDRPPSETAHPGAPVICTVLGQVPQATCLLQITQAAAGPNPMQSVLIQKIAEPILHVMQRLLVLEDLETPATHDPLTGLLNRQPMEVALAQLCQTARRDQAVSLILIEIDQYQALCDHFGPSVGPKVLKDLSGVLKGHGRSQDIVCRYGQQAFGLVLLEAPLDVALTRAEKIRWSVKYLSLTHGGEPIEPLTLSLGVAGLVGQGQTASQLLDRATQALHWAQAQGGDCTASADTVPPQP